MNKAVIKLLVVAGARPNFMKIAPLFKAAERWNISCDPKFELVLVHTGQHYDDKMSHVFFKELGIPEPAVNLEVGSGTHACQTAAVMQKFEPVCLRIMPDWVVVVGDVNSTMACTLVCSKIGVKVAHVEAGLRSFDRSMPEEVNRLVTDCLADLLLTPSQDGNVNLLREGVEQRKVFCVGNIMIDSLQMNLEKARASGALERHGLRPGAYAFVTLHRPANVDNQGVLSSACQALNDLSSELPVIFPVHPRTRKMMETFGIVREMSPQVQLVEPLGYLDSLKLTENARLVITDSGGLQEESTFFRTPCLTLRPNTERPVTVSEGSNKLTTTASLKQDIRSILAGPERLGRIPALWDGRTAERVLEVLAKH